jgi:1-acyl-sn-glycerol-3-phosphate acyltransferase
MTPRMRLARSVLGLFGWRVLDELPPYPKCVLVGAFHTSNWDFPLAILAMWGLGVPLTFVGKQELTNGRLGPLMRRFGVIGIERSGRARMVERLAEEFTRRDALRLVVPAEGTRSKADYWRTGFYYIALKAGVPIAFAVIDAARKEVGVGGYFYPSGDREADLAQVAEFYRHKRGLKPHKQGEVRFKPLEAEPPP